MNISTHNLPYQTQDGTTFHNRLYLPSNLQQPVAGILVFPEWWGLSEHILHSAERLSHAGYAALAVDLYGNGLLTDQASEANKHMTDLVSHPEKLIERTELALNTLRNNESVNPKRIAAIGFCFGGRVTLDMARRGTDINAAISFHGILATETPAHKDTLKAAILIEHAGADSMVSDADIQAFRNEMNAAHANYHIDIFEGVKHGFTNPQATVNGQRNQVDVSYNEQAANDAWLNMLAFLSKHL